jgi:hypothetical protein
MRCDRMIVNDELGKMEEGEISAFLRKKKY